MGIVEESIVGNAQVETKQTDEDASASIEPIVVAVPPCDALGEDLKPNRPWQARNRLGQLPERFSVVVTRVGEEMRR